MMKMSVNTLDGGITCVELEGTLDLEGAPLIETDMANLARQSSHMIVDMSAVDYIASSGVSVLVQSAQTLSERDGGFALYNVRESVAHVLRKMAIDRFIPIVGRKSDAVATVADTRL